MNQILMMGNRDGKSNRGGSSPDIKKIVIFFAVAIIVFGLIFVIKGVVDLNKNKQNNASSYNNNPGQAVATEEPVETADPDATPTAIPTPKEDTQKPTLDPAILGNKVRIIAEDDVELAYIAYTWNEGEQEIIAVEGKAKADDIYVDILPGKNTLRIVAVDKTGKESETSTLDIKGRYLPEVELFIIEDENALSIKAKCEDGLASVEWKFNGGESRIIQFTGDFANATQDQWAQVGVMIDYNEDGKIRTCEYKQELPEETTTVSAYAYSIDGEVASKQGNIE